MASLEPAAVVVTFFAIFPLANAVLDFASWFITRYLLQRMVLERVGSLGFVLVVAEIGLDLIAAALCLIALAVAMGLLIEALNLLLESRGAPIVDWRRQVTNSLALPFYYPQNWPLIGMLASTVVPTAMHLASGAVGILNAVLPKKSAIAMRIHDNMSEGDRQNIAADLFRLSTHRQILWLAFTGIILATLLWFLWIITGRNIGQLAAIAFWAADLLR